MCPSLPVVGPSLQPVASSETLTAGLPIKPSPEMPTSLPGLAMPYWQGTIKGPSAFKSPTSALQDVSNPHLNINSGGGSGSHQIPVEDGTSALKACRSRRKLADRLAAKTFSPRERASSDCHGKALNSIKVKAIYSACMKYCPLQRLEMAGMAVREMRYTIG